MSEKKDSSETKQENPSQKRWAVVQVRGTVKARKTIIDTLRMLHLWKQNQCVVFSSSSSMKGMLMKVKDYVTWGEISEETYQELLAKRGIIFTGPAMDGKKKYAYRLLKVKGKIYLPYFTLNPPRKGYGRKGIKVAYLAGGALGYRGEHINTLILRMV